MDNLYLIKRIEKIKVRDKLIKITYCTPYQKRREKNDQILAIYNHLETNGFGTENFDDESTRTSLRNLGIRNVRITEL